MRFWDVEQSWLQKESSGQSGITCEGYPGAAATEARLSKGTLKLFYGYLHCEPQDFGRIWDFGSPPVLEDDGDSRGCRSFPSRPSSHRETATLLLGTSLVFKESQKGQPCAIQSKSCRFPIYSLVGFWEALAQNGEVTFRCLSFFISYGPGCGSKLGNWNGHIQSTKEAINLGCFVFSGNLWVLLFFFATYRQRILGKRICFWLLY